jgi:beta-phosphoglucomutase-like phosphatase (HAD superfamily)
VNEQKGSSVNGQPWTHPDGTTGLIFDCDGTLAHTMPIHYVAWRTMLEQHGFDFPEATFYSLAGVPSHGIIRHLAANVGRHIDDDDVHAMTVDKESRFVAELASVRPIDEVVSIVERYRGVLPMAVASGGERWVVERTLGTIGVLDWFEAVVCFEDTDRHKPEPDVFLEAARRLNVAPGGCVVFEDADLGLEAARRAGMLGIDVRSW